MKDHLQKQALEKKAQTTHAPSVSSPQELTCTEGQVDDLLAEGETTESEAESDDAGESTKQTPASAAERKSTLTSKSSLKQK